MGRWLASVTVTAPRLRRLVLMAVCGLLVPAALDAKPRAAAKPRPVSVVVAVAPGQDATVRTELARRGIRANRRTPTGLQVVARTPAVQRSLRAMPGVASVTPGTSAHPDAVVGQGVERTGAAALADVSNGGAGLRIAIIDLGFGTQLGPLQARGELPPPARLRLQSFDPANGIAGTTAYGGPTDHGMLVAQTVYDFAPRAHYTFVSYHTPEDFVAATNWIAAQRFDIAVHSNNFLEGPFDGTSPPAQAVDRAAEAGVLWFNSAGNYGQKRWGGDWNDPDGDNEMNWPTASPWIVTRTDHTGLTYHLSWRNSPGAEPTDIDLVLEREVPGGWQPVAASRDRQSEGAASAERINGLRPSAPGRYRLRAFLVSGPPPESVDLYSREDEIADIFGYGDASPNSIPTPADSAGSIAVGAVDWRSNSLVRYSSRGPTPDGRLKPDLVAPTGTAIAQLGGPARAVGGTSIAAPNAAGATAALISSLRAERLRPSPDEVRAMIDRDALDLGAPGPDPVFGVGRIRVEQEPPELSRMTPRITGPVRGNHRLESIGTDPSGLAAYGIYVDGWLIRSGRLVRENVVAAIPTRRFPDGVHRVEIEMVDGVGNRGRRAARLVFDNTAPRVTATVRPTPRVQRRATGPVPQRRMRRLAVRVAAHDAISRRLTTRVIVKRGARTLSDTRAVSVSGRARVLLTAPLPRGPVRVVVLVTDRAGNTGRVVNSAMVVT